MTINSMLKKVFKYVGIAIISTIGFVLLYLGAAYGLSRIGVSEEQNAKDELVIFIKTNGVHTDIVVPVKNEIKDWSTVIPFENTKSKATDFTYLGIGWGDKGFYLDTPTWAELKASVAFAAATGIGSTAIHTTYFEQLEEDEHCKKIEISKEQYKRLIDYIEGAFQKEDGRFIYIETNSNYGQTDAFYEANGSYSIFHTCNSWSNNALKTAGQKACYWTPFDTGIFLQYE